MSGVAEVEAYLALQPPLFAECLRALRAELARLLPGHIECMSYAMPGFRTPGKGGKMVAGYAGFARHMGLYPHSGSILPALSAECAGFRCSKSGVLFTPAQPLPAPLVARIIRARQAEIATRA